MEGCFTFQWGGVVFQVRDGFIFKCVCVCVCVGGGGGAQWGGLMGGGGGGPVGGFDGGGLKKIVGWVAPLMPPPPLWETLGPPMKPSSNLENMTPSDIY